MTKLASHFRTEELLQLLEEGVDCAATRKRLLFHLGCGCLICGGRLEALAEQAPKTTIPWPKDDVLLMALRRWLQVAGGTLDVAALRPAHGYWARRVGQPLVFLRVLLEEARHTNLTRLVPSSVNLALAGHQALEAFCQAANEETSLVRRLEPHPWKRWLSELQGLALGYLGVEYWHHCRWALGTKTAQEAKGLIEARDPIHWSWVRQEILATLKELDAEKKETTVQPALTLELLEVAGGCLVDCRIPGRRAENSLFQAKQLLLLKRPGPARDLLYATEPEALESGCSLIWLQVIHGLAIADFREGFYHLTRPRLTAHQNDYDQWAPPWLMSEKEQLLGLSLRREYPERADQVIAHLAKSFRLLCDANLAHVSPDLFEQLVFVCMESSDFASLDRLAPQIEALLNIEPDCVTVARQLVGALRWAEEQGNELPRLRAMVARKAQRPETWRLSPLS